jgi:hypothetical protein
MKSLRQIVELKKIDLTPDPELQAGQVSNYANPKSEAEKNFVGKHLDNIQTALHPAFKNEAEQDAVFKGGSIKKDHSKAASYKDGNDAEVYEQAIHFVRDNLTEDNLKAFDELAQSNPEAAVEFAMEMVEDLSEED